VISELDQLAALNDQAHRQTVGEDAGIRVIVHAALPADRPLRFDLNLYLLLNPNGECRRQSPHHANAGFAPGLSRDSVVHERKHEERQRADSRSR
jgi:hypothetical protein